jgi:hypothetical protein
MNLLQIPVLQFLPDPTQPNPIASGLTSSQVVLGAPPVALSSVSVYGEVPKRQFFLPNSLFNPKERNDDPREARSTPFSTARATREKAQ